MHTWYSSYVQLLLYHLLFQRHCYCFNQVYKLTSYEYVKSWILRYTKLLCCGSPHRRDHLPSLYRAHPLCGCCLVPAWHRMLMMLETVIESLLTLGGFSDQQTIEGCEMLRIFSRAAGLSLQKTGSELILPLFNMYLPIPFCSDPTKKCFLKHNNNKKKRLEIKNQPPWIEFHMRWPFHKAVGFYGLHTRRWLERMEARSDCD